MVRGNITFLNIPKKLLFPFFFFSTSFLSFLSLTLPWLSDELAGGAAPKSGASPAAAPGPSHRNPQICTGTGVKWPHSPHNIGQGWGWTLAKSTQSRLVSCTQMNLLIWFKEQLHKTPHRSKEGQDSSIPCRVILFPPGPGWGWSHIFPLSSRSSQESKGRVQKKILSAFYWLSSAEYRQQKC